MFKIIDILIVLAMVWFGYQGIKKGLIYETFSILAILIGGWGAVYLSNFTAKLIGAESEVMHLVSLALTFFVCIILVIFVGKLFKISISFIIPEIIDKILGFVFGLIKVLFFVGILFYYIVAADQHEKFLTAHAKESILLFKPAYKTAAFLLPKIKSIHTIVEENNLLKKTDSTQTKKASCTKSSQ